MITQIFEIELDGLDVLVEYEIDKAESATRDYPGCHASANILRVVRKDNGKVVKLTYFGECAMKDVALQHANDLDLGARQAKIDRDIDARREG